MTDPTRKPGEEPFPPVPAAGPRAREGDEREDSAAGLAATFQQRKPEPPPDPAATAAGDLGKTIVHSKETKLLQIPGLKLVKELGRGAHGVVYHGKQEFLDREVAVKMLLEHRQSAEFTARFKREAKLLAGLQHPNIVTCYQADVTPEGVCFLVMEYVGGPNLREYIEDSGPLDPADALRVCRDLAAALGNAYEKKIIHRDVKSENVLLANEPGAPAAATFRYRAKLSDLGLARPEVKGPAGSSLNLTVEATVMGTPLNMSPEQFDDPQGVDHRTDIYSLGCVLYDMLTGKTAFKERTLSTLVIAKHAAKRGPDPRLDRAGIDPETSELVARMLSASREDRPQTYAELIETCDRLLSRRSTARVAAPPRSKTAAFTAVVALALVGAGVVWWAFFRESAPPEPPPVVPLALAIEPPRSAREGEEVVLAATVTGADGAAPVLAWEQKGEPRVELKTDGLRAAFVAPRARAKYDLTFVVRGDAAGKTAESKQLTFTVEAQDDPPAISVEGGKSAREHERVTLAANVVDPDAHGELAYAWKLAEGPDVALETDGARVFFEAPEAAKPYELSLSLAVTAGGASWSHGPITVPVAAVNDPPRVELALQKETEAGEIVQLDAEVADADSASELKYEWTSQGAASPKVDFANATALRTQFVAPENASGNYELELALSTADGALPPVVKTARLAVRCDPALNSLAAGKEVSWVGTVIDGGLAGWAASDPPLEVQENPDGLRILPRSAGGNGWLERAPNRGKFAVTVRLQSQGRRAGSTCGVRLLGSGQRGASVCLRSKGGDECDLIVFETARDGSSWSMPAPAAVAMLAPWKNDEAIELELAWDGASASVRWRAGSAAPWSEPRPLELGSRPRSVSLFASQGSMLVNDVRIRGL